MTRDIEHLGRIRLQGIALLILVFAVGALAGAAFEHARRPLHRPGPPEGRGPVADPGLPPFVVEKLGLTPAQDARIHEILESSRPRAEAVMGELLPRLQGIADSTRREIRAVLDPEQQKLFDQLAPPIPGPGFDGPYGRGRPPGPPPPFDRPHGR